MRMDDQDESSNVEDARGSSGGGGIRFGGGRGIGIGTVAIALVAGWVFGINPLTILGLMGGGNEAPVVQTSPGPAARPPADDTQARFVSQVLRSTEVVWSDVFRDAGKTYRDPRLTLYRHSYPTGCGEGDAAMGPFYCPADAHVYLDMSFFDTMATRLGAPGQFAQAYVIAHEVGHHVQNLLGTSEKVEAVAPARARGAGQRDERATRTAGRLLRRRLGQAIAGRAGLAARAGRHRDGAQRRLADRRRHAAAQGAWPGRSRELHPRQQRSSASAGSSAASNRATRTPATPSTRASVELAGRRAQVGKVPGSRMPRSTLRDVACGRRRPSSGRVPCG